LEYNHQLEQLRAEEIHQRLSGDSGASVAQMESMIPLPKLSQSSKARILSDIRNRVALSAAALPSVAMFTFCNTYEGLTAIAITEDSSVVAAGFGDSVIRLWNLKQHYEHNKEQTSISVPSDPSLPAPSMPTLFAHAAPGTSSGAAPFGTQPAAFPAAATAAPAPKFPAAPAGPHSGGTPAPTTAYLTLIGHSGPIYGLSFSPDNRFLISGSQDGTIRLWSVKTGTNIVCYKSHNYAVWTVQFSPAGYYFASGSHDRTARLWTTDQISPHRVFVGHFSDVDCLQFHPNCNYLATGSSDKTVRIWEIHSGECLRILSGHIGGISALAFSPNGRFLASGSFDKTIQLWDIAEGTSMTQLFSHRKVVWSLAFSREGSILASGSADRTVRLWNIKRVLAEYEPRGSASSKAMNRKRKLAICPYLLESFPTKATPVFLVQFTRRNLLLAAGTFQAK
jgi:transcription initiation factor TFIID subunit 5